MKKDPRVEQLLTQLTKLQPQYALFKEQATQFAQKFPANAPERERIELLTEQLAQALEKVYAELGKMGVSQAEIDALIEGDPQSVALAPSNVKPMPTTTSKKPNSLVWIVLVIAVITCAAAFYFLKR